MGRGREGYEGRDGKGEGEGAEGEREQGKWRDCSTWMFVQEPSSSSVTPLQIRVGLRNHMH